MTAKLDNRMRWIRHLEQLPESQSCVYINFEIASECQIPGLLLYEDQKIVCQRFTIERSKDGLYSYLLKVKYPRESSVVYNENANAKGYYFKDGIISELQCLFSLFFRCRFYLKAVYHDEIVLKWETDFPYHPCNQNTHSPIFSNEDKNFAIGLGDFLDTVKALKTEYHQQFILACYHYNLALKAIGVDPEMVFIRLVSCIEALSSRFIELNAPNDQLIDKNIAEWLKSLDASKEVQDELRQAIAVRKSRMKFIRFLENYSEDFFEAEANHDDTNVNPTLKVTKSNLPTVATAIYKARSAYLHNGEPMYLSRITADSDKWHFDPSLAMIVDNRRIEATHKLPYTSFFEGVVRHCLLNFLKTQIKR